MLAKALRPTDTWTFAGLDYDAPGHEESGLDFAAQARRMWEMGADGMKMLEGKPNTRRDTGMALDDPRYDSYYRYLQDNSIPILFHVADPEEFWDADKAPAFAKEHNWLYTDPSFPSKEQLYRETESVLTKFPRLRVVFAHFFFLSADLGRASGFLDRWPSVCFDITPGSEMYYNFSKRAAEWCEFFVKYQDRIVFGTDNTAHTGELIAWAGKNVARVRGFLETRDAFSGPGLALPDDVLERIYHANFERVFGAAPRTVDMAGLVAYGAVMLEHARAGAGSAESAATLEAVMEKLAELD